MYNSFFGFTEKPFNVTPDPRIFYGNPVYNEVYANLLYAVRERKGFATLIGEVGTGKTTLLRKLMEDLALQARFVYFYNTTLSFEELLSFICHELSLQFERRDGRLGKILALNKFLIDQLRNGRTAVLLIDEAQNLTNDFLENLRLLSNLETGRDKLLQIILAGQSEFELKLEDPSLRQLRQRISIRCRIECLKETEIGRFVNYRLAAVGCERNDVFSPDAIRKISRYSMGFPRFINIICDNALLIGYATGQTSISPAVIDEVAGDLMLGSDSRSSDRLVTATTPDEDRGEPQLHAQTRAAFKSTCFRDGDVEHPTPEPHVLAENASGEKKTADDGGVSHKTMLDLGDAADRKQNQAVGEKPNESMNLSQKNVLGSSQAVSKSMRCANGAAGQIAYDLRPRVFVTSVSHAASDTVPEEFFDTFASELTTALGPMADFLMRERLHFFGATQTTFPRSRLKAFVESVSTDILHDRLRAEFQRRMLGVIESLSRIDGNSKPRT